MTTQSAPEDERIQKILLDGEIELQGQFVLGNNYTFLVKVTKEDETCQAVYKPGRGEQPLWDFPEESLSKREVAAYLVSQALGWNLVPTTVLRKEGPFGIGSLQRLIEHDPNYHYFNFSDEDRARLLPAAVFDLLVNNADRKGSHILVDQEKKIWLIDHGLCFHEEEKLRTVIWDFSGEPIPLDLLDGLRRFKTLINEKGELFNKLAGFLSVQELTALELRCERLLADGFFPTPPNDRRAFPYPPV
jgi:uncharacterized repeat protein (TIGR03843 family)